LLEAKLRRWICCCLRYWELRHVPELTFSR